MLVNNVTLTAYKVYFLQQKKTLIKLELDQNRINEHLY